MSPANFPFSLRKHKGSFEMTPNQQKEIVSQDNLRATISNRIQFDQKTGLRIN
jgi:hypothetical protein